MGDSYRASSNTRLRRDQDDTGGLNDPIQAH
jgi:hypothetical protein